MSLSKPLISLPFFFFLFLHSASAAAPSAGPLYHFCFNNQNFTANTPFDSNLNSLLALLSTKVLPSGYGVATSGQAASQVNGLGLCRGDVSSKNCKTCVVNASKELRKRCPYKKGAIIWYDNCLVKYSDKVFFGQIDNGNKVYMWNTKDVKDPKSFDPKVRELLSGLSYKASSASNLYAIGDLQIASSGADSKLYGLVQCTRDLSGVDCKKCLDGVISEIPKYSSGKRGGRVVVGSCYVRYELYPIV